LHHNFLYFLKIIPNFLLISQHLFLQPNLSFSFSHSTTLKIPHKNYHLQNQNHPHPFYQHPNHFYPNFIIIIIYFKEKVTIIATITINKYLTIIIYSTNTVVYQKKVFKLLYFLLQNKLYLIKVFNSFYFKILEPNKYFSLFKYHHLNLNLFHLPKILNHFLHNSLYHLHPMNYMVKPTINHPQKNENLIAKDPPENLPFNYHPKSKQNFFREKTIITTKIKIKQTFIHLNDFYFSFPSDFAKIIKI
jgi:hypothetical protein